ncbi:MAG: IS481 family transposase, partial [Anaerolineales bacterium]
GRAKLTPYGRLLLIQRIMALQWSVTQAAASLGVSRPTAYAWLARWQAEGAGGLEDRSSRPHTSPRATPERRVHQLLTLRRRLRVGPHRLAPLVGLSPSTIYDVLRRHGLSRLRDADRVSGVPIRYVREHPGELLHLDMKPLARVPAGGGHRMHGRSAAIRPRGGGYEVVHVAIDDASRLAFAQVLPDGRGPTAARFLIDAGAFFAEHGVRIQRVMTDRSRSYTMSRHFQEALQRLRTRHKITRPYRPQTNGKAERFIQTLLAEWAYARLYRSNEDRLRAFPKWLHHYNNHRPHTALGGQPPIAAVVNNVSGKHT